MHGVRLMQHIGTLDHLAVTARKKVHFAKGVLERWTWLIRSQPPIPPIRKLSFVNGSVCQMTGCELTYNGRSFKRSSRREELLQFCPGLFTEDGECLDLWTVDFRLNILTVPGATLYSFGSIPLEAEWARLFAEQSDYEPE